MTIGRHFKVSVLGYEADQKLVSGGFQTEVTFESHKGGSTFTCYLVNTHVRFREEGQQEQARRVSFVDRQSKTFEVDRLGVYIRILIHLVERASACV